jgi:leader peptidase (prepilin peptidase)/N-methyltransferase
MNTLSLLLSFVFGTIIGSFLNVVSLRYNTGMGVNGRSKCFTCGKTLTWKELIPLFSFAVQKGACKKCKSKISWQYPLVEFLAGVFFVLIFLKFPPVDAAASISTVIYLFITSILIVITVYDMKHKIIPDALSYTFSLLAFIGMFFGGQTLFHIPATIDLLAGPLCALPFALLWLVSKGTWMGFGDAKLALGIGWTLGFLPAVSGIILAFWIGAVISVVWMLVTYKKIKGRYEIPFAPYLILGMYLVLIFNIQVIDLRPLLQVFNLM